MAQPTISRPAPLSATVLEFCGRHELLQHLREAVRLAEAHFDPARPPAVELEVDPESDEQALVITVEVAASVDETVRRKRDFTYAWLTAAPAAARDKIRLLCDIVA